MWRRSLDTSPLRRLLLENINEAKIRKNGKDLGLVTIDAATLKPVELFIDDINEGDLVGYLLASSAFPGFDRPEIGGKKYIDGGLYNNVPYSMARKRGYRNIIVVDISGFGMKQRMDIEGCRTVYIKNSISMGSVLDFNREFIEKYQIFGYLDTLRTFGRLNGYHYFLTPDQAAETEWRSQFVSIIERGGLSDVIATVCDNSVTGAGSVVRDVFPKYARFDKRWLMVFVDCTAYCLGLEPIQARDYPEFIAEIQKTVEFIENDVAIIPNRGIAETKQMVIAEIKNNPRIKQAYYYYLLISRRLSGKSLRIFVRFLIKVYPELAAAILFIGALKLKQEN
jgi:NTE family protein